MGVIFQLISTEGTWTHKEARNHINILELLAVRLAIFIFTKEKSNISSHLKINRKSYAFLPIENRRGTRNRQLLDIIKSLWE